MRFKMAIPLVLGLGLVAVAGPALAQDDDEDDLTFEQRIIHSLLGGSGGASIDYRERSPLVIPPSADLPSPGAAEAAPANPAWPQDADKKKPKKARAVQDTGAAIDRANSTLSPAELAQGRVARTRQTDPVRTRTDTEMGQALRPNELDSGGQRGLFGMITRATGMEKPEPFTGEPARTKLTQPPTGYRTPVGNQPYAPPGSKGHTPQIPTLYTRTQKND